MSGSSSSSSLLSLASSFGVNLGKMGGMGTEALFPTLYPDLMNSVDFKTSLFPVLVTIEGDKDKGEEDRTMSYYDYMENEQKAPWWSAALPGTMKWLVGLFKDEEDEDSIVDPFRLTKEQTEIVKAIDKNIVCDVDKKTMVISIKVTDQDPVICATMADTVKTRLQNFITDYRTSKARVDLEYNKKLYVETKARYDKARRLYAEFVDANQDIILQTVRQRQVELENEMQIQYNAFTQVSAQLLAAEAKVQEETPAFTTLQSATVPVKKTGPKRARICLVFLFLAFLATTTWILHKEDDLKPLLGLS
jgi:capsular polysaccharide biosynthesis protein